MRIALLVSLLLSIAVLGIVGLFSVSEPDKQSTDHGGLTPDIAEENFGTRAPGFGETVGDNAKPKAPESDTADVAQPQVPGFHVIDLTAQESANLQQAPFVFLNPKPSEVLQKALELGQVDYIRADRDFSDNEFVTQGWIFYEPLDGQIPVVLCLSQTRDIIDWMYCQEATRPETGKVPSLEAPEIRAVE